MTPSPSVYANGVYAKRAASCTFPKPPKTSSLSVPVNVKGTFNGKGACSGQKEGGNKEAVFLLKNGATLKNVVIGANQAEDVCEDAITLPQTSGTTNIIGGGTKNARDKIIQHDRGGAVNISSYCVQDFGKLYRACGNCKTPYKRIVIIKDVIAKNGRVMVGVNSNYGGVETLKNNQISGVSSMCNTFQGNTSRKEPTKLTVNKTNANMQLQVLNNPSNTQKMITAL